MRVTIALDGAVLFDSGDKNHAANAVKAVAAFYADLSAPARVPA